jgi:hypothetical protein
MLKMLKIVFLLTFTLLNINAEGQHEHGKPLSSDSLSLLGRTSIGGYGNVMYQRDFNAEYSTINFERLVLFIGHKFSSRISLLTELEIEDAKVAGGEEGGELALEQCYLRFNINPSSFLVAGLFLPRIGIINENHLPNTFNGNERPRVERYIIPSTWRELGVGIYGTVNRLPLAYSFAIVNGLNAGGFEHGSVIRGGRFEGKDASANNLALTGSVQFYKNNFSAQMSGYYGGSVGLSQRLADSLKLESGFFGTPVMLGEANIQYAYKGFAFRLLGSVVSIPDASDINRAFANNTPEFAFGAYAEAGYNLLESSGKEKQLIVFGRFEQLDMNAEIPANGIIDGTLDQQHIIAGLTYLPIKNIAVKADVRLMSTGDENPALIINPDPVALPYEKENTFLNIGIGFSF